MMSTNSPRSLSRRLMDRSSGPGMDAGSSGGRRGARASQVVRSVWGNIVRKEWATGAGLPPDRARDARVAGVVPHLIAGAVELHRTDRGDHRGDQRVAVGQPQRHDRLLHRDLPDDLALAVVLDHLVLAV